MRNLTGWTVLALLMQLGLAAGALAQEASDDDDASDRSSRDGNARRERLTDEVIVFGTREEGYVSNSASSLGPLGDAALIDTPVSVYVMSRHLIENLQVVAPDMLYKVNPVLQFTNPQSRFFSLGALRGFSIGTTSRIDGIPLYNAWASPDIEDKDRVEIITGLSGFFNGVGNVGGTVNYIRKRPTGDPLAELEIGLNGGTNAYAHGDFGGMFGKSDRFGYRVNLLAQGGDTAVDHQSIERQFASAAFDWNVTGDLLLQLDASYSDYEMKGTEPYWATAGVLMPPAPDPDNFYGQPFTFTKIRQDHVGGRLSWRIDDTFQLRAGVTQQNADLRLLAANNQFVPGDAGDFTTYASNWKYPELDALGGYMYLHAAFDTGSFSHKVTAGYFGDTADRTNFVTGGWTFYPDTYNYDQSTPVVSPLPAPVPIEDVYRQSSSRNDNFVIADQIGIGERWSLLVGLNRASIRERSYDVDGTTLLNEYDDGHLTPSYAVLYRFNSALSGYVSYMEGLERGGTAGTLFNGFPVVNAGETMPPLVSDQVEIGMKAQMDNAFFTAALFEINKGLEYYDQTDPMAPVFTQDGRQVHRGLELTLTGEVVENVIVVAGFTALDPEIKDNSDPALVGNEPGHVAERFGTLYAEYQLPALPALTITGGAFYTGDMYIDTANTDELPSYVTYDLGARYETSFFGDRPVTFRLNVTNVTNENHWLTGHIIGSKRTAYLSASTSLL